jgi:PAS domain S-box-containing protein
MKDESKTREQLIEELAESRRSILEMEMMPATICLQAPDYSIRYANRRFRDTFGDPEGRACYEVLHGRPEPCEECTPFRVLETGEPLIREWANPRGEHFMVHYHPFRDDNGEMLVLEMAIDITERKKAEELLRQSEETYRVLVDALPIGVTVTDLETRITFISNHALRIHGYEKPEEVQGTSAFDYIAEEDHAKALTHLQQTLGEGMIKGIEFTAIKKGGTRFPVEISAAFIRDIHGEPSAIIGITQDVSQRREEEKVQLELQNELQAIYEGTMDGILVAEIAGGRFARVNEALCRMFGYTEDELLSMSIADIHPADQLDATLKKFRDIAQGKYPIAENIACIHKGGGIFYADITGAPVNYKGVPCNVGMFRDSTERKKAEEELERINHLFLSLGSDLMENIVRVIEAAKEILGVPFAAYSRLQGGKLSTLSSDPGEEGLTITEWLDGNISYELIQRNEKEPWIIENLESTDYSHTDSIIRKHSFQSFLGYPVGLRGRTIGCLCLFDRAGRRFSLQEQDIAGTLARVLSIEEERLAREENLKDFIDIASHELRHPITIMKGYSLILKEHGEDIDEGTRDVILNVIDHGADRLDTLVEGLLDISRIERGRFKVKREVQPLVPLIERALEEIRMRGFETEFINLSANGLGDYSIDGEKIVQLLVILLENAVKYSPSRVPVEVGAAEEEGEVVVSVLDRGIGIPDKYGERVFERFFQVEEVAHHSTPGMGMGLYIARSIMEAHGGRIWCEPREGGGSVFRFAIPSGK